MVTTAAAIARTTTPRPLCVGIAVLAIVIAAVLLAMAHDLWRQRRVHFVYVLGVVLLVLQGPAIRVYIRASEQWHSVSAWLSALVAA